MPFRAALPGRKVSVKAKVMVEGWRDGRRDEKGFECVATELVAGGCSLPTCRDRTSPFVG